MRGWSDGARVTALLILGIALAAGCTAKGRDDGDADLMDLPLLLDSRIAAVSDGSSSGSIDFEMTMPSNLNFKKVRFLATATDQDGRRTSSFSTVQIIGWD